MSQPESDRDSLDYRVKIHKSCLERRIVALSRSRAGHSNRFPARVGFSCQIPKKIGDVIRRGKQAKWQEAGKFTFAAQSVSA